MVLKKREVGKQEPKDKNVKERETYTKQMERNRFFKDL